MKTSSRSFFGWPDLITTALLMAIGLVIVILLTSCARFTTTQNDISYQTNYAQPKVLRAITTKASAYTLFTAKSHLANFKANQTDKTQGASVGLLNQESTGTNAVAALQAIQGILQSMRPAP